MIFPGISAAILTLSDKGGTSGKAIGNILCGKGWEERVNIVIIMMFYDLWWHVEKFLENGVALDFWERAAGLANTLANRG